MEIFEAVFTTTSMFFFSPLYQWKMKTVLLGRGFSFLQFGVQHVSTGTVSKCVVSWALVTRF